MFGVLPFRDITKTSVYVTLFISEIIDIIERKRDEEGDFYFNLGVEF